jgi:hypothetical protein
MPTELVWYNGQRGSWCQSIVEWLTADFNHVKDGEAISGAGAIVVVKADQVRDIQEFNRFVSPLKWVLVIVTANEDGTWQWDRFKHPNSLVWLQTPHKHQHAHRVIPWGWTPGCMAEWHIEKKWEWSFAGQITHPRREEFLAVANSVTQDTAILITTKGFAQGVDHKNYYTILAETKVAPCPSGPVTVDSMRVCEALQLGAIPILDAASPTGLYDDYWQRVFPGHPLRIAYNWRVFPAMLKTLLGEWHAYSETTRDWWTGYKLGLKKALEEDLLALGAK